ncbi:type VII secretion-associated serine protease mycosin [Streptomyces sp. NPDC127098]|uniref:type VII secretion-associated serine protease mycosin n=1 Tax=Streptomyces sp. NPDC127098 TaxID=3347137 RepID=UPI00365686E3
MRAVRGLGSSLAAALALLAAALPGAVTPAAASEPCRTEVGPQELPAGVELRPLVELLGLPQAWDLATGEGVTVAVVDSGVDATHPDLDGRVARGSEFVGVRDEREFRIDEPARQRDCEGHGTAVAGLIAARGADGEGVIGVAPGATVYPVRIADGVENATPRTFAAAIADAVAAGADVINLSLAIPSDYEPIREAVEDALAEDVVVVAAAGNEGDARMYPAAYDGVLAVGAVDAEGQPLDSSNPGDWVDLAAIGADQVVVSPGGEGYRAEGGTSMAAAQVSAVAALVRSRFPDLPATEVVQRLVRSATPLGGGRNDRTGAGLVDPFGALTGLGGQEGEGGDDAVDAPAGRVPVVPLPRDEPLLGPTRATGLAVSGVLLLAVLVGLLAAPGLRRAARRGWRAGTAPRRPAPEPPAPPGPPAARLVWLGGDGEGGTTDHNVPHQNRSRTP